MFFRTAPQMPSAEDALPGREASMVFHNEHYVLKTPLKGPVSAPLQQAMFGMDLLEGAEKAILEHSWRVYHRRGLQRWLHPQPDVQRGLHG